MSQPRVRRVYLPPSGREGTTTAQEEQVQPGEDFFPSLPLSPAESSWLRLEGLPLQVAEQVAQAYRQWGGRARYSEEQPPPSSPSLGGGEREGASQCNENQLPASLSSDPLPLPKLSSGPEPSSSPESSSAAAFSSPGGVLFLEESFWRLNQFLQQESLVAAAPAVVSACRRWLEQSQPPSSWRHGSASLSLEQRPLVMGILNVTPDSFSDGGRYLDAGRAVEGGLRLSEEGADLLDIGGESTRPGSLPVAASEEKARILPVIRQLARQVTIPLSVDTTKATVAASALEAGATIVNDVSGLRFDPDLARVVAESKAGLVVMHSRQTPKEMQREPFYHSLWREVLDELEEGVARALEAGVDPSRIAVDPGLGFGKRFGDNYQLIRELPSLRGMGFPIVLGASRKSFLGRVLKNKPEERLEGSLAVAAVTAWQGSADLLRVHDVAPTCRLLQVIGAIRRFSAPCTT